MTFPNVAIIGAGPAGCMLGRLLHLANISVTVFEGEETPNYRSQGGSLDLHTSTGLVAMKDAGLFDKFLEKARYGSDSTLMTDKHLNVVFKRQGAPAPKADGDNDGQDQSKKTMLKEQRPEIDRPELRRILTESLPAGLIRWGHHLREVAPDGRTLVFTNGTTATGFDLVVGADGAWSKVRALLSPVKPEYSGVSFIEMVIPDAAHAGPEIDRLVDRGTVFAYEEGKRFGLMHQGDGSLNVIIALALPDEHWVDNCGYDARDPAQMQAALLGAPADGDDKAGGNSSKDDALAPLAGFHPTLHDAVRRAVAADSHCNPRPLYQLPVGFRWAHQRGATLVGDAAHLMTPFGGVGVNVALQDALYLARGIIKAAKAAEAGVGQGQDGNSLLDAAVLAFEEDLWFRGEQFARLTDDFKHLWFFTPGTPYSVVDKVRERITSFQVPVTMQD